VLLSAVVIDIGNPLTWAERRCTVEWP
jgi:hypothetical protein